MYLSNRDTWIIAYLSNHIDGLVAYVSTLHFDAPPSGPTLIRHVLLGCHRYEMPSGEALENVSFTCENAGLDFGRWRVLTSF